MGEGGFATTTRRYARATMAHVDRMSVGSLEVLPPNHEFYSLSRRPIDDTEFKVVNHLPITDPGAEAYFSVCEYDRVPARWVPILNQSRVIMTQSSFCQGIFAKQIDDGSKIKVVPYILGRDYINFQPGGPALRSAPDGHFVFGSVFEWVPRKVPERMIISFLTEFGPREPVHLVLRTCLPPTATLKRSLAGYYTKFLRAMREQRITVESAPLPDLVPFYRGLDAFIMPSAGEGWGQPLSEAMACGLPTIGSNHSGNLDFMDGTNSYLVDVDPWSDVAPPSPEKFRWKLPRMESIRANLRQVYEDSLSGRATSKIREAVKIRDRLTPEKVGLLIFKAIREFL